jgi:ADP-heptose:LPS heptosyltransferase
MFEGVWKESPDREEERPYPFMPWENHQVHSILVIHQGALGDFILALPSLDTLRKTFLQARLILMGYPRILELVDYRFYGDGILSVDQRGMSSFFVPGGPLDPSLSRFFGQFDLMVIFGRDEEGALTGNLRRVCHGQILHIHPFPPWGEKIHLTEHLLRQFSQYGFRVRGSSPRLHLKESDHAWGRSFFARWGLTQEERSKVIILHPGSGSKRKVWPAERFLDLSQILRDRLDSRILIILGPAEGPEVERVFKGMDPQVFIQVEGLSLLQLASVMEGCRFFIGNDSGVSHMASALGIPTMALFGPTDPTVWSPRGEKVWVVRSRIPCSPCGRERFFQCSDSECMKEIGVEEVLTELTRIGIGIDRDVPANPALKSGVESIRPDHGGHNINSHLTEKPRPLGGELQSMPERRGKDGREENR